MVWDKKVYYATLVKRAQDGWFISINFAFVYKTHIQVHFCKLKRQIHVRFCELRRFFTVVVHKNGLV